LNASVGGDIQSHGKTLFSLYINGVNLTDVAYQNHLSRLKYADINPISGRMGVFNKGRNFSIKLSVPINEKLVRGRQGTVHT
jgi:iron complex outermembrane receptor protein